MSITGFAKCAMFAGAIVTIGSALAHGATAPTTLSSAAPTPTYYDVKQYGAKGDGISNDTAAIQAAIDAAHGIPVFLPAGHYVISAPLRYRTRGNNPGAKLFGSGSGVTTIDAQFSNGYVLEFDGSGTASQFQYGGSVHDLSIDATHAMRNLGGIQFTACFYCTIDHVEIMHMSADAVRVPERPELGADPDGYASIFLTVSNSRIVFNHGWGIRLDGKIAAGNARIERNQIIENMGGGIFAGGHQVYIGYNAIASNGEPASGGVEFDQTSANGLVIEHNEFESNYRFHLWIHGAANGLVQYNRFNSSDNVYRDAMLHPNVQILLGDNGKTVRNFSFIGNNHRSGVRGRFPLTMYQIMNPSGVRNLKVEGNRVAEVTGKLIEYEGLMPEQGNQIIEGSR